MERSGVWRAGCGGPYHWVAIARPLLNDGPPRPLLNDGPPRPLFDDGPPRSMYTLDLQDCRSWPPTCFVLLDGPARPLFNHGPPGLFSTVVLPGLFPTQRNSMQYCTAQCNTMHRNDTTQYIADTNHPRHRHPSSTPAHPHHHPYLYYSRREDDEEEGG